jgi:hypothetical protein
MYQRPPQETCVAEDIVVLHYSNASDEDADFVTGEVIL